MFLHICCGVKAPPENTSEVIAFRYVLVTHAWSITGFDKSSSAWQAHRQMHLLYNSWNVMLLQESIAAAVSNDAQLTGWSTKASPVSSRLISSYAASFRWLSWCFIYLYIVHLSLVVVKHVKDTIGTPFSWSGWRRRFTVGDKFFQLSCITHVFSTKTLTLKLPDDFQSVYDSYACITAWTIS